MIDTHAHVSMLERRGVDPHATLNALFGSAASAGGSPCTQPPLRGIIDISLEPGDLAARIEALSALPQARIRFASGLWPHPSSIEQRAALVPALEKDIARAPAGLVCALGEFGLDRKQNVPAEGADSNGERELMEMQMDLARRLGLPVIIHSRDASGETAAVLAAYPGVRGVIHCYSYGPAELRRFLDMGYVISFAGNLTYKNAGTIRDACVLVPPGSIFFETDCPYLAPVPFRGKPAHPGMVAEVYRLAAELRKTDLETLTAQCAENVQALFGVDFPPVSTPRL